MVRPAQATWVWQLLMAVFPSGLLTILLKEQKVEQV
jgi:hypothetical protein